MFIHTYSVLSTFQLDDTMLA